MDACRLGGITPSGSSLPGSNLCDGRILFGSQYYRLCLLLLIPMKVGEFYCYIQYSERKNPIWNIRGHTELEECLRKVRSWLCVEMQDVVEIYHFHHGEMILVVRIKGSNAQCDENCIWSFDRFQYNGQFYG